MYELYNLGNPLNMNTHAFSVKPSDTKHYMQRSSLPCAQITFTMEHMEPKLLYLHAFNFMSHSYTTCEIVALSGMP